ncbi:MOSC domain-containing protein [Nocardioides sp. MAHUQ-72]|uniref:MOSC domain-containing protein n=1 Tax=unclassified Nocardioides TaxID=2615069 RepID=UPI00361A23B0
MTIYAHHVRSRAAQPPGDQPRAFNNAPASETAANNADGAPSLPGGEPRILSLNVGSAVPVTWARTRDRSAIDKGPVGSALASPTGLAGDECAERRFHGGPDRAVYAFAREEQHHWSRLLDRPLDPGSFGENLTTVNFNVDQALLGELWRVGQVLLEVADVRTPCAVFQHWIGHKHPDAPDWLKRFTARARPGAFLRVLEGGTVRRGDPIEVVSRPAHSMSVSAVFTALTTDRRLLPQLLDVPALAEARRATAAQYAARHTT